MFVLDIIAAILFVGSSGLFFHEKYQKNVFLVICAGLTALVSSAFLVVGIIGLFTGPEDAEDRFKQVEWEINSPPPGSTFRDCGDVCPEMVVIPTGNFLIGSPQGKQKREAPIDEPQRPLSTGGDQDVGQEGPQQMVWLSHKFAIGKFPVTFAEWDACAAAWGCSFYYPSDNGGGRGNHPVNLVSWEDAQQYVRWLSQKTGHQYRLLTEAEYEYATRAGTTTSYYWGKDIGSGNAKCEGCDLKEDAKIRAQGELPSAEPSTVGRFPPNRFGLYDMVGNVFSWTEDCWNESYAGMPTDGSAWKSDDCDERVVRGGSSYVGPTAVRSAYRNRASVRFRSGEIGFRVARTY